MNYELGIMKHETINGAGASLKRRFRGWRRASPALRFTEMWRNETAELHAAQATVIRRAVPSASPPVFNLVWHIVENQADASDILQDVFVKVFKGVKGFNGDSSLRTWIYRIAVHEASNHHRSWIRRHWREPISMDDTESPSAAAASEAASCERSPYEVFEQAEREVVVNQALASLGPPYRTVVVLREIEGLPYEEIAQVLGLAEGTVKSRLLRGRELLRRKLAGYVGREHV
jgi:RNA polymerase sigma-70 factor (ECF subfamily)